MPCESSVDSAWRATIAACIVGLEHREPVLARLLGRVHRDVRVAQQVVGLLAGRDRLAAMPMLAETLRSWPSIGNDDGERGDEPRRDGQRGAQLRLVEEQDRELVAAEARGQVAGPDARLDAVGDGASSRSPAACPSASLTSLKLSRSRNRTTGTRPGVGQLDRLVDLLGEQAAVGEAGQRVVVGLVAELLLEPRQLRERLLQLAVLERDGRLVGERLEQPQVVVENVVPSVRRLATTIDPISPDSPRSGAAIAWRTAGRGGRATRWRNARRSWPTRRWSRSASASGTGTIIDGAPVLLARP